MVRLVTLLVTLLLSTLGASSVWAQASEMSSGEIRKVDKGASKITIKRRAKHDMPLQFGQIAATRNHARIIHPAPKIGREQPRCL